MRNRTQRALHVALTGLLAAGALALPASTATAASSSASFSLAVTGGSNNGQSLGTATGTVTVDGGSASYTVQVCGQSTYPNSVVTIKAGSATASHSAGSGACQTFGGPLSSTSPVASVNVELKGATFYPGNEHRWYTKSTTLHFSAPTPPPTQVTRSYDVTSRGGYNNQTALGNATGTITATRGQTTATYSVRLCGQQTYPSTNLAITAGSKTVYHSVSYSSCQDFTGTIQSTSPISTATIQVDGGTFYPGNEYRRYPSSTTVAF